MATRSSATRVGVTGANGFIGSHLVRHLAVRGFEVRAFQRSVGGALPAGVTEYPFVMPDGIVERDFEGLDALVHGAVREYGPQSRDSDEVNRESARRLMEIARRQGTHLVYLSTLSAHDGAESHYGRNKLEIEALFDPGHDCVLRLGLVLGDGGLFGSMLEMIRSSRFIPLADGGRQPIQTLWMGDLLEIVERVIARRTAGRYDVAAPGVHTMRELYESVMGSLRVKRRLVPVPLALVQLGIGALEALRIPFPIQLENVLGLKHLRAFDTAAHMRALGCERPLPFGESVERLMGGAGRSPQT